MAQSAVSLGAYIRLLRKERGWTQAALAERAYVSARTVGDIEAGVQTQPRADTLRAIELALDIERGRLASFTPSAAAPARRRALARGPLAVADARALMRQALGALAEARSDAEIDRLTERVDRRAAAIVQFGRRLATVGADVADEEPALAGTLAALAPDFDAIRAGLGPDAQRALLALAAFARVFDAGALAAVAPVDDVVGAIEELHRATLIERADRSMWKVPQLTRRYAGRLRGDRPNGDDERHLAWAVAATRGIGLTIDADTAAALAAIDAFLPEYLSAIRYGRDHGALTDALRIATELWYYFWVRGRADEGLALLGGLFERYDRAPESVPAEVAADAFARGASLAHNAGNLSMRVAARWAERAIALYERAGLPDRALKAMVPACSIAFELGEIERSRELAETALALSLRLGATSASGVIYNNLGAVYEELGDYPRALEAYRSATTFFVSTTPTVLRAYTSSNIGTVLTKLGRPREAIVVFARALRDARRANADLAIILVLREAAEAYGQLGHHVRALRFAEMALRRAIAADSSFDVIAAAETLAHWCTHCVPSAAAALYGAVDTLRLRTDRPRRPGALERRDGDITILTARLGEAEFERLRFAGIAESFPAGLRLLRPAQSTM